MPSLHAVWDTSPGSWGQTTIQWRVRLLIQDILDLILQTLYTFQTPASCCDFFNCLQLISDTPLLTNVFKAPKCHTHRTE